MATRAPLSQFAPSALAESDFARRVALARQPEDEQAPRPKIIRLVGELEHLLEPVVRRFRTVEVAKAETPRTVMVLPGFATHPVRMRYLAQHLEAAGHTVKRWGLGFNWGPTEERFELLEKRLRDLHERSGEKVVLLGWSLGGLFAREIAKKNPDAVAKVITMGSPFSGNPRSNHVWRLYQFVTGHSVDNPPIESVLAEKPPVETVALWSPRDGIIHPRAACGCHGERDRAVALRCTHMGFSYDPEAIGAVLRELAAD